MTRVEKLERDLASAKSELDDLRQELRICRAEWGQRGIALANLRERLDAASAALPAPVDHAARASNGDES